MLKEIHVCTMQENSVRSILIDEQQMKKKDLIKIKYFWNNCHQLTREDSYAFAKLLLFISLLQIIAQKAIFNEQVLSTAITSINGYEMLVT